MRLFLIGKLSAAGGQAAQLAKLPAVGAVQITPAQPEALAARVVTETASPSYWRNYQAWEENLWKPTVMAWDKAEGGGA